MVHTRAGRTHTEPEGACQAALRTQSSGARISQKSFYGEYHGHTTCDLELLADALPEVWPGQRRSVFYLVGDSSFDNKYWLDVPSEPAANGLAAILAPPRSVPDVTHHLNAEMVRRGLGEQCCALNAAVEESCLSDRFNGKLTPQDQVVRAKLQPQDAICISVGGNDIALRPSAWTVVSMISLLCCPTALIEAGLAPGLGHFVRLFGQHTKAYVESLTTETKPRAVVVTMLYYLGEYREGMPPSWADRTLSALGYNRNPAKLQLVIRKIFQLATSQIKIDGVEHVVAVPFFKVMDGTTQEDYVQRVEPSSQGGRKMARAIMDAVNSVWR